MIHYQPARRCGGRRGRLRGLTLDYRSPAMMDLGTPRPFVCSYRNGPDWIIDGFKTTIGSGYCPYREDCTTLDCFPLAIDCKLHSLRRQWNARENLRKGGRVTKNRAILKSSIFRSRGRPPSKRFLSQARGWSGMV